MKDSKENKKGNVCWTSESSDVENGFAIRCLGPDGAIFEDSAPEVIIKQLAAEDGVDFLTKEKELKKNEKKLTKEQRKKLNLGQYVQKIKNL